MEFGAFKFETLNKQFCQVLLKDDQGKILASSAEHLISKFHKDIFKIEADTFNEGTYDLQYGVCSRRCWQLVFAEGIAEKAYLKVGRVSPRDFPDHDYLENLISEQKLEATQSEEALRCPFNLFRKMKLEKPIGKEQPRKDGAGPANIPKHASYYGLAEGYKRLSPQLTEVRGCRWL
jgi:hypothetical protein